MEMPEIGRKKNVDAYRQPNLLSTTAEDLMFFGSGCKGDGATNNMKFMKILRPSGTQD